MATKTYKEMNISLTFGTNSKRVVTGSIFSKTADAKKINKNTNEPISGKDKDGNTRYKYGFFVKQSMTVKEEGIAGATYKDQDDVYVEFWSTEANMRQLVAKALDGKNYGKVTVFMDIESKEVGDKVYTNNVAYAVVKAGSEDAAYWFNRLITDVKKDMKIENVTTSAPAAEPVQQQATPVVTAEEDEDLPF